MWKIAGDTANQNAKWVRGLDVEPNVAPNFGNVKLESIAKYGPIAVGPAVVASTLLSGNLLLGLVLGIIGIMFVILAWYLTREEKGVTK